MQSAGLDEAHARIKIAGRNINNFRYADDTILMAESKEELKRLLLKVKEESKKDGLKQHSKYEDHGIWSHHLMAHRWGNNGNGDNFIFLGSKITADVECSHEIKWCLLLGEKAMTNLDSILKSRDITLPTKVDVVKAMVFPVVMYGCESWAIKKEIWMLKNWCFWTVVLENTLESPFDCKEIQPVNPKGNQSWIFIGRTDAKAEAPILWPHDGNNWLIRKDHMLWKTENRRRGQQRMRWLGGITDSMSMSFSKLWGLVIDGEACHVAVHGVTKS